MYRVLFAEDDASARDSIVNNKYWKENDKFILTGVARNGKEAWDLICENDYDIVITDIKMPIIDGLELSKKIDALKESGETTPQSLIED